MTGLSDYFSSFTMTPDYKAPSLSFSKVWDQADTYYFTYPTAGVWAADVITFTAKNHNLISTDSVIVESNVDAWNIGAVTATVTNANTFTVPRVGDPVIAFPNRASVTPNGSVSPTPPWTRQTGPTGGTANGTLTKVVANRASAIAETWTLTSTNATTFTVVGSLSGSKANATVGVDYDNGIIAFLLTAGTTAFHTGGATVFTITVMGGNLLWTRVSCKKYSRLMFKPTAIQIAAATGGGTLKVMGKLHPDAGWHEIVAASGAAALHTYPTFQYNLVRLERVGGSDSDMPICYTQS